MRKTLTAALVEKTLPPSTGRLEINDSIIPQLALRITPNGMKSYVLRTRIPLRGDDDYYPKKLRGAMRG